MRYPIVIHKDEDSDFGVTVPDLPGCFSAGSTLDEAIVQAQESIECHIEGLLMDGDPIPSMADLEQHRKNPDYAGGIWAIVAVDLSKLESKTKRINITLPERVLRIIDEASASASETRSGFLVKAALEYVERHANTRG